LLIAGEETLKRRCITVEERGKLLRLDESLSSRVTQPNAIDERKPGEKIGVLHMILGNGPIVFPSLDPVFS